MAMQSSVTFKEKLPLVAGTQFLLKARCPILTSELAAFLNDLPLQSDFFPFFTMEGKNLCRYFKSPLYFIPSMIVKII